MDIILIMDSIQTMNLWIHEYIKLGAYKYVVLLPEWLRMGSPVSIPEPKIFTLVPLRRMQKYDIFGLFFRSYSTK